MSVPVRSRLAGVILVDPRGWLLIQERDEHAPVNPLVWGLVGGGVEPGETLEQAAYRELEEETGISLAGGLVEWYHEFLPSPSQSGMNEWSVWIGGTRLTDDDIVLGEGRQIVFRSPTDIQTPAAEGGPEFAEVAARLLRMFLASEAYAGIVTSLATGDLGA
jgi:8-oxo-dGTP diphosphatase